MSAGSTAPATIADLEAMEARLRRPDLESRLKQIEGFQKAVEADNSFGRIFNGPQWLGGASIMDGTVSGKVFEAEVTISTLFKTGTSPADRAELDASGLRFYGTVSGTPNTKTVDFQSDGDFLLGTGSNQIAYTASTGVLTVPAAVITSLTIANVGSGVIGGTYNTASANPRVQFSVLGIKAFNGAGTNTVFIDGSDGSITITGTFTAQSATSGARVELSNAGTKWYRASGSLTAAILNDGSGFVGTQTGASGGAALSWTTGGVATLNVANATIQNLSFTEITSTGTLGASQSFGVKDLTINSTGKLYFGTGSTDYLANDILHFELSGTDRGTIEWMRTSFSPAHTVQGMVDTHTASLTLRNDWSSTRYALFSLNTNDNATDLAYAVMQAKSQGTGTSSEYSTITAASNTTLSTVALEAYQSGPTLSWIWVKVGSPNKIEMGVNTAKVLDLEDTNARALFYGRIYPGPGTGSAQTTRYLFDNATDLEIAGGGLRLNTSLRLQGFTKTGTAQAFPTGASPTSVIMSVDAGATLLSIGVEAVTINVDGTNRRFLAVAT